MRQKLRLSKCGHFNIKKDFYKKFSRHYHGKIVNKTAPKSGNLLFYWQKLCYYFSQFFKNRRPLMQNLSKNPIFNKNSLTKNLAKLGLIGLIATVLPQAYGAEATIVKTAPRSATQIAIVPFAGAKGVSDVVENYLTNIGQMAGSDSLPENPYSSGELHLELWQARQVPYVVVGNSKSNRGNVEINFEVINVQTGQVLGGVHTEKAQNNNQSLRFASAKIADKVLELITGIKGDFSGKIAYVVKQGTAKNATSYLVVSDVDGYNPQIIRTVKGNIKALNPSANGRQFTFEEQQYNGYPVVYVADINGGVNLVTPYKANNLGGAISPNGSQLLFSSDKDGNPDIYLANANGGNPRRLTNSPAPEMYPSWSPDGKSFVFTSDRHGNNRGQIFRYNLTNGQMQQLTSGGLNSMARISNDGKQMSYLSGTNNGVVRDLTTGSVKSINNAGLSEAPSISPNGMHYIYSTKNALTINTKGNVISINPSQYGVPKGTIYNPIWLNPNR